ncbi:PVC-type heme-binding CxxCH protein [Parapedobacter tibetensis]|uniref:PVC-type heme-binding CxxCH protein n=1 Tax=Parapedobacter tibetensis TaxID=2972951 RepID=UPI00214D9435|nr:PVC-type heme-binding CxxCH protein [Parapedobacter tibetensis]
MYLRLSHIAFLFLFAAFVAACSGDSDSADSQQIDREYVLDAKMIGYTGIGGDIDGRMNPVLRAKKGERVKVSLINGELMAHDIVLEKAGVKSETMLEEGDTTSVIFKAMEDDIYYCSLPGHQMVMRGQFKIVEDFEAAIVSDNWGVSPRKDGRPLNFGFERGNLQDWQATGNAFGPKSVTYDPAPWYPDSAVLKQSGDYYVSSGGTLNYQATGMLTSTSFKVTHPWASFKVTGGAMEGLRVELVDAVADTVVFKISGYVTESEPSNPAHAAFRPVVVDLMRYRNKELYIRLVDDETGTVPEIPYIADNPWAHISFDDFRFHEERPSYANELRPDDVVILPAKDVVPNAGLSGAEAAKVMELPDGFSVTLAAAEPDIIRPIAFTLDDRGRLWVVEAHTYPVRAPEGQGRDRILIFEDTNGDGVLDSRKVFMEKLNMVSAIALGFGGVWLGAAPYLMFIPVDWEKDAPAGEPQILLDGFAYEDTHEVLNTFKWGPDGWLYGTQGVFTHSNVGKPGAPDKERIPINAGVWRFHPTKHEFEVFSHGMSNPWGIDFNDHGHTFATVCVIPHLFHMIQGGRYHRQAGEHFNPYTYEDIKTIADHVHWLGDRGPHAGNFRSAAAGGGHAHVGAMFYLGNKHWGINRNAIFMNNINGFRVNMDITKRLGSGYTASHGKDFINTNDFWSQWLNFQIAPSGSVYVNDWYDKNQCHSPNPDVHDKTLGRIFRISHREDKWVSVDLTKKTDQELVEYQLHENEFYVVHSRLLLQERGANDAVRDGLWKIFSDNPDVTRKLRALWALHVTGGINEKQLLDLLDHDDENIRAWGIQLLAETKDVSADAQRRFERLAKDDASALVRLHLASALQRMEPNSRWGILKNLSMHEEDAGDQNIPLMVWYALEPLVALDANRASDLAKAAKWPVLQDFVARRIADGKR